MAGNVEFHDYSLRAMAALDDTTIAWLHTWAPEVAAQAARNCQMDGKAGTRLRGSYDSNVDEAAGVAQVGTPLEEGYWEEFGTGEWAAHDDGRKGWWIYFPNEEGGSGGATYATREEAEEMLEHIRIKYGKKGVVTNGRRPAKTLENSFKSVTPRAEADLAKKLKERMD